MAETLAICPRLLCGGAGKRLHEPNAISREDPSKSLQQNLKPLPALGLKTHSNLLKMELYLTQAQFWSYFGFFAHLLNWLGQLP
jgi:hypothetical protein